MNNLKPDNSTRCRLHVSTGALRGNVAAIRRALPPKTRLLSVVKANAYGLGADHAVRILLEEGLDFFGVANVTEAMEVRALAPQADILLLSATLPEEDPRLPEHSLLPTISSLDEIERYREISRATGRPLRAHAKIDTGMGRLGVWHEEAQALLARIEETPEIQLEGLYTHFYDSGDDREGTETQRRRFLAATAGIREIRPGLLLHADNSGGIFSFPGTPFNAARCGLLQYGIAPGGLCGGPLWGSLRPVVSVSARLTLVKNLPAGAGISYSHSHRLTRPSRVGVLSVGYADGIPRSCSNRGRVLVRGQECQMIGNVTMDEIMVDVTDVPEAAAGDEAILIGRQGEKVITMESFSERAGTIPWESLCFFSRRMPRVWGE